MAERKKNKMRESTCNSKWLLFPAELMSEVLQKLPLRSMCLCKCVCKSWRSIISDPAFLNLYGLPWKTSPTLLLSFHDSHLSKWRYMLATLDTPAVDYVEWFSSPNNNDSPYHYRVTQVINSLVCFYDVFQVFLCNLSTGEIVNLPHRNCWSKYFFGFEPISGAYKLLNIQGRECWILTLEEDMSEKLWKRVSRNSPFLFKPRKSVCVAGTLYWLDYCHEGKMISFNLKSHMFKTMSFPKVSYFYDSALEFKGRLAFAYTSNNHFNVVSLKGNRGGWTRQTFALPIEFIKQWYHLTPFGSLPTGEIMLVNAKSINCQVPIYSYDPESQKFERFVVTPLQRSMKSTHLSCFEANFNPLSLILKGN